MNIDFEYISKNIGIKKYQLIGSGSGRLVYDLDNGYVVKMAKNKKGLLQNKAEYQIASANKSRLLAKILAISDDFQYLIMEKAEKIKAMSEVLTYYEVHNFRELFRLEDFKEFTNKHDLLLVDLRRLNSWGVVKGKPVLIDFGFTREVSKYYHLFNF